MANYYQNLAKNKRKRSKRKYILFILFTLIFFTALVIAYFGYQVFYKSNVWLGDKKSFALNIHSGNKWDDVKKQLYANGIIINRESFEKLAEMMKYPGMVKPGHYMLKAGMNNRQLLTKLRSGAQDPVELTYNNIRTIPDLAGNLAKQIEADSLTILTKLKDRDYVKTLGYTPENVISMFIPNTYQVYWNIPVEKLLERMDKECEAFWNPSREEKLKQIGLTRLEAYSLASIVEKESNRDKEKPDIAGVYMNRLHQGWLLQADPTLVFALGDFSIKRVLNVYKTLDSPYNTYKYHGLPPGPICIPSIASIDAVLNYSRHDYMYFCAREDFSGYHNFAATLDQHNLNAQRYQEALNRQGILK